MSALVPTFESSIRLDPEPPAIFLSDLHFGDGSTTDLFAGQDRRLIDFLERHRGEAETIVFVGDILDMPQAWSPGRVIAAHPALIAHLRALAREQRVIFVRGNHDWNVDYEAVFPGAERTEAVLLGPRTLVWHGHQMDVLMNPGAANAKVKIYLHAFAERLVGTRLLPPIDRYDTPVNRAAVSLAVGWARLSVARAGVLRSLGREREADELDESVRYLARSVCGDPADVFGATKRAVFGEGFDNVLCGHTHVPGVVHTEGGLYANSGTWASGMRTYATWSAGRFAVYDVDTGGEIRDEHYASVPEETTAADLFDWWTRQWQRGLFRGPALPGVRESARRRMASVNGAIGRRS